MHRRFGKAGNPPPQDFANEAFMRALRAAGLAREGKEGGNIPPQPAADSPHIHATPETGRRKETNSAVAPERVTPREERGESVKPDRGGAPPRQDEDRRVVTGVGEDPLPGHAARAWATPSGNRISVSRSGKSAVVLVALVAISALVYMEYPKFGPANSAAQKATEATELTGSKETATPPAAAQRDVASSAASGSGVAMHADTAPAPTPPAPTAPAPTAPAPTAPAPTAPAPTAPAPTAPAPTPSAQPAATQTQSAAIKEEDENKLAAQPTKSGKAVYMENCSSCHDAGGSRGPALNNVEAWTDRLARGKDSLYANAISGKGAMKPKGGNPALQEKEIKAAVDYMTDRVISLSVSRASGAGSSVYVHEGGSGAAPLVPAAEQRARVSDRVSDWRVQLRQDLARCNQSPEPFARGVCIDMARWKHCAPARWGQDPECPEPGSSPGTLLVR